jgi:hypothetical protein
MLAAVEDGGEAIYRQFAREEAADRRRGVAALAAAAVAHLALLAAPVPWGRGAGPVTLPPTAATAFRLQALRFAPPQPPAAVPLAAESPSEAAAELGPPPDASAELLVPAGPAGDLVPPQPLVTPPPPYPPELWRRGGGGEVLLTLVVDAAGEVAEVTVEAVRLEAAGEEDRDERIRERRETRVPDALAEALGRAAAESVRHWLFLPATLSGNPISTAVTVRVAFPAAARAGGPVPASP